MAEVARIGIPSLSSLVQPLSMFASCRGLPRSWLILWMAASKQGRGGAASNGRMEWRRHPASDLCRWYKRRTECLNICLVVHCISCHLWTLDTPKTLIAALSQSSPCLLHFPLLCVIAQTAEAGTGSGQQAQMNTCNWRS